MFNFNNNNNVKFVTPETRLKKSIRNQGVSVKIYDKSNNLINQFSTTSSAAKYLGVVKSTISRIYDTGISYDEYIYKFEPKNIRIKI